MKRITTTKDGREALLSMLPGVEKLMKAVGASVGPYGQATIIMRVIRRGDYLNEETYQTSDGYKVAKNLILSEPFEKAALQQITEAAERTANIAGDGTTTTLILACSIFIEATKLLTTENIRIRTIPFLHGIKKAVQAVLKEIELLKIQLIDEEQLRQVALSSSRGLNHNDSKVMVEAVKLAGDDGYISINIQQFSSIEQTNELRLDIIEGLDIDNYEIIGKTKPNLVGERQFNIIAFDFNPFAEYSADEILELIEKANTNPLIILINCLASDFDDVFDDNSHKDKENISKNVLNNLLSMAYTGGKDIIVIGQRYSYKSSQYIYDAAAFSGASILGKYQKLSEIVVGKVGNVSFDDSQITLYGGQYESSIFKDYVKRLRQMKEQPKLAKMLGKYIKIQGYEVSSNQAQERKILLQNILSSVKNTVKLGIVPGAGTVFIHASKAINQIKSESEEEKFGHRVVQEGLSRPLYWIARNSGKEPTTIVNEVRQGDSSYGYDAIQDRYINLLEAGIIDSYTSAIVALQNAADVTISMINFSSVILTEEIQEEKDDDNVLDERKMEKLGNHTRQRGKM